MDEYFMGQIMMTGFGFAPKGFAGCNGATLSVSQNAALFSLLGVAYGGDGRVTFMLPDLRGRTPTGGFASQDPDWQPPVTAIGTVAGVESVSLTGDQNPAHTHPMIATTGPGISGYLDGDQVLAEASGTGMLYGQPASLIPLGGGASSGAGAGAPHDNMQPFATINFNIAMSGSYPSRG